ncbi:MAG: ABC transporter ATP-binding protein [Actinobacteria bacterium]|nr:ABC transporter ATP-binding protein [Actinomycetota bacterium]
MSALLEVDGLTVTLPVAGLQQPVLRDISFTLGQGEALGLVGESGSGKSMTARAIGRLLPPGAQCEGRISFDGDSVLELDGAGLRTYRTHGVAMIFQDPRASINPVRRVGDFLTEALVTNEGVKQDDANTRAAELLDAVGIDDPRRRMRQYPHQLSGGMLQRVMIAAALLINPRLILADEPTTALDVTTQAEVMAILDTLRRERGVSMLFITHDLELAAAVCDRTAVMYAGLLMEEQRSLKLDSDPLHPYTAALVQARPDISVTHERLLAIPGRPLSAFEAPPGCAFGPRCPHAEPACAQAVPPLLDVDTGRSRCRRLPELRGTMGAKSAGAGNG